MTTYSFNLSDFVLVWWGILYEAMPFVVLGTLLSGVVERCLSREVVVRFFPTNRVLGVAASACLGLVFPMCECGVVPVVRRLVFKGVPVSCAVAYMLASPIINPLVMLSTFVAFNRTDPWAVTGLRVGMGYLVAVTVGMIVWTLLGERNVLLAQHLHSKQHHDHQEHRHGDDMLVDVEVGNGIGLLHVPVQAGGILVDILVHAARDFMVIGATLVVGAALAALINSGFSRAAMEPLAANPFTAVGGMSVLAVGLNLCSEADAFVARSFLAFPLAAQLAFLVLGPMVDLKLIAMYTTLFRPRAIVAIMGITTLLVVFLCISGYTWLPLVVSAGM